MNGKPRSHRALKLSALAVNHPDLDGTDSALLGLIAEYADAATGGNSRPGNVSILAATKLKYTAAHDRITKLCRLGLIERTIRANGGRGLAAVYRICFENPAYPGISPNGREPFSDNPLGVEKPSGNHPVRAGQFPENVQPKPSGAMAETIRLASVNRPVETPKPSGLDRDTSEAHQEHINNIPTTAPEKPSGALPEWLVGFFFSHNHEAPALRKNDKQAILQLIALHGEGRIKWGWKEYVESGPYNEETKWPAYQFLESPETYIKAGWKRSPEARAQKKEQEDIEMAQAEKNARERNRIMFPPIDLARRKEEEAAWDQFFTEEFGSPLERAWREYLKTPKAQALLRIAEDFFADGRRWQEFEQSPKGRAVRRGIQITRSRLKREGLIDP